jgi:hypothetical protein
VWTTVQDEAEYDCCDETQRAHKRGSPDHPTYACSAPSTNARDCVKKRDPHDNEDYDLRRNELVLRHARPIKEAVNQQAERIA